MDGVASRPQIGVAHMPVIVRSRSLSSTDRRPDPGATGAYADYLIQNISESTLWSGNMVLAILVVVLS